MRILDLKFQTLKHLDVVGTKIVRDEEKYGTDSDSMHNFSVAAILEGRSVPEVIASGLSKDIVHIYKMTQDGKTHEDAEWEDSITTAMTYLSLLLVAVKSDKAEEKPSDAPVAPTKPTGRLLPPADVA